MAEQRRIRQMANTRPASRFAKSAPAEQSEDWVRAAALDDCGPSAAGNMNAVLRAPNAILDLLPVAAFICDARGTIVQYNRQAVEIWGARPKPGQSHAEFRANVRAFELDGRPITRYAIAEVLATGAPVRDIERLVERADSSRVIVSINVDPLFDDAGQLVGAINCFYDITERKRMDETLKYSRQLVLEQEQRVAATYEHAAIGITEVAPDGRFLRVNEAICGMTGFSHDELLKVKLYHNTHPDDVEPDRQLYWKQIAGELDFYSVEKRFIRKDGRVIWLSVRSSPVFADKGHLLYLVRVLQDITERKAAERRAKLLIDELKHRVKNTLATVQSLASQTLRADATPSAFRESFEGRPIALSKAHDQLTNRHWESAFLRDLLSASLAPFAAAGSDQIVLSGDDVELRPRAVLTLAMAFHELTTNAAKYGALSAAGGRVAISWRTVDGEASHRQLCIDWAEKGGPPVAPPQHQGFGSRLIERSIATELGGRARLSFKPDGLRCEIIIPLEQAAVESGRGAKAADWSG